MSQLHLSIAENRAVLHRTTPCSRHSHLLELHVELAPLHQHVHEDELVGLDRDQLRHSMAHVQARGQSAGIGPAGVGRGERAAHGTGIARTRGPDTF